MKSFLVLLGLLLVLATVESKMKYKGVNQAGAEFLKGAWPGQRGDQGDFQWPKNNSISVFVAKGMNIFRIPISWERMQPKLGEELDSTYLMALHEVIEFTTEKRSAYAIIDVHNYFEYRYKKIGSSSVPVSSIKDLWKRLGAEFKNNPRVIFGLMNEPHSMTTQLAFQANQQALNGVREAGANQLALICGNGFSSVDTWTYTYYGTPNAEVFGDIEDPANNFAIDMHQYFDGNGGTQRDCSANWNTENSFKRATKWLRDNNIKGFLGEFGWANNARCNEIAEDVLSYLDDNSDVWIGWTYWAAGPKWGTYMYNIEPKYGQPGPQASVLFRHLDLEAPTPSTSSSSSSSSSGSYSTTGSSQGQFCISPATFTKFTLSCPTGQEIKVSMAMISNFESGCPVPEVGSCKHSVLGKIRELCDGKRTCSEWNTGASLGLSSTVCPDVSKNFIISYSCI